MLEITLAGPPDSLCDQTEQLIRRISEEHRLDISLVRVSDFESIIDLGVFAVPGVIINGELKSVGRVPGADEFFDWLGLNNE